MPLIFENSPEKHMKVAVWEITETEELLTACLPPLFPTEQALLEKFSFLPRRLEWLASRVLLYKTTGIYPSVSYNQCGQPIIPNASINVSISHTRGYAAVAVSPVQTIGIDIEYPSTRIEKVAHRFLHPTEAAFTSAEHMTNQLALIWCAKEAIFKMAGKRDLIFKEDLVVAPFIPLKEGTIIVNLRSQDNFHPIEMHYSMTSSFYLVYSRGGMPWRNPTL